MIGACHISTAGAIGGKVRSAVPNGAIAILQIAAVVVKLALDGASVSSGGEIRAVPAGAVAPFPIRMSAYPLELPAHPGWRSAIGPGPDTWQRDHKDDGISDTIQ
jgi:hypothetical protein